MNPQRTLFLRRQGWSHALLVILALLLAHLPPPAQAESDAVNVCLSGCPFSSIQQAINASSSGVTLRIGPGTYRESLTLRAGVSLVGAGVGATVVSGNGSEPAVTATGSAIGRTTVVEGLSITGGGGASGGGVRVTGSASPTLRNLVIQGNNATQMGGGVAVSSGANPLLQSVIVRNNTARLGAGVALTGQGQATLRNATIENNSAADDGGGVAVLGATLAVDGATLAGNSARHGGALIADAATITLTNSVFQGNSAQLDAGAVRVQNGSQVVVDACRFIGNRALSYGGGAILGDHNGVEIRNSTFDGNRGAVGAAVHLHYAPNSALRDNTIINNQATDGAGVYVTGGRVYLSGNVISHNTASMFGGGVVVHGGAHADLDSNHILHNTAGIDGGGVVYQTNATGSLLNNVISHNRATEAGGGAKLYSDVSPTVSHNTFEGNQSNDGAAMQIERGSHPLVENNVFKGNTANNYGGAVVVNIDANPTIRSNTLLGNRAGISGGAMVIINNSRPTVRRNTIAGNSARVAGGILVMNDNLSQIVDNYISHNTASEYGAGIYLVDSNARVAGNQILDNQAGNLGGGAVIINRAPAIENNLFARNRANGGAGVYISNSQATLRHNNIVNNGRDRQGDGVMLASGASPSLLYNVITGNDYGLRGAGGEPRQTMRNNVYDNRLGDYQGISPGATDLRVDPQFMPGPLGPYYLAQPGAGLEATNPLIDACSETAQALGLDRATTRVDLLPDQGLADIGFHYDTLPSKVFLPAIGLSR